MVPEDDTLILLQIILILVVLPAPEEVTILLLFLEDIKTECKVQTCAKQTSV
jgi:hypothetical protein